MPSCLKMKNKLISCSKIIEGGSFIINAVFLYHIIPYLTFSIQEKQYLNIKKSILNEMKLTTAPWLTGLREKNNKE
jgi:hypothetical protein